MDLMEAIEQRHSVRSYRDEPIEGKVKEELQAWIEKCNQDSGLDMQLVLNEPKAFDGFMAHYGKFSGVRNYIALVGKKSSNLEETCGYYGEKVVLKAQQLGLNTCWVALTMSKGAVKKNVKIGPDEKLVCVIAIGYGTTQGIAHKSKPMDDLCHIAQKPEWFVNGMKAVMLALTAVNQQKFQFSLDGDQATAKTTGGFYSDIDLGIAKYHFEIGAKKDRSIWIS